ncbi:MAG: hypothetical protein ACLRWQ_23695 [Flavonifractor plautii]
MLAQSPQLYKQAMVGVLRAGRRVRSAPVFRAEKHATAAAPRAKYTSLDSRDGLSPAPLPT